MMGGYLFEEECDFIQPRTLVLVGKTGNGKSATGNSILGAKIFLSKRSSSAVTTTCELKTTVLEDGQTLNVIDTPGLFDSSLDTEFIGKEIVNCINMARDGINAFLVVMSVRSRFAKDEKDVISRLLTLFGRKFHDYMIIVFTGGDELEDDDDNLEDFLSGSPEALQETLRLCGNRCVLFDNKTKDPTKRSNQIQKLLSLVNMVSKNNRGNSYTNEICTREHDVQQISVSELFKGIYEMVESKLKEIILKLEQLLAEERTAWVKTKENAKAAQKKTLKLEEELLAEDRDARLMTEKEILKVEMKLKETTLKLEQLLIEERTARLKAEEDAKIFQKKSDDEIQTVEMKLKETTLKLEQLLIEERTARLKAEEDAKIFHKNSDDKIQKVQWKLTETTLKVEQLLADEWTAQLKTEECAKAAQKKSEEEHSERGSYVDHLFGLISAYKVAAASLDPKYGHINWSDRFKVSNTCAEAEIWLRHMKHVQDSLPKHAHPVLLSSDIRKKAEEIDRVCRPIMSKPNPAASISKP